MLKHLDDLECHPVFYRRKEIQIILNNEKSKCSSYFLDNFKPELLSVKPDDIPDHLDALTLTRLRQRHPRVLSTIK
jgi:hypothetical protein